MNKIHFILIVLLGFFLMPGSTYACGTDSGNHSCKMEMTSKTKMKDCCSKKTQSKESKDKGCSGKCGQFMCNVSSVNIAIASSIQYEILNMNFNFSEKKQNFSQAISVPLDGYATLWLIPKIG
ncbi:hypothetical protein ACSV4D_00745 [Flavobacterium sp. ARAG 55.4]|uniref:hypothetical protein n=1 Tax=Flavobacterium sp. ARAG 55.4 TaxID=3451357 RepID=UPI003F48E899